jgi:flagellar biosynthesis protein FlhG
MMKKIDSSNKVISLTKRIIEKKQIRDQKESKNGHSNTRIIAVTSGKAGVGKSNIVANLGYALSQLGKKVLILDGDLSMGNIDVLLGLVPKYDLSHVIQGLKSASEIILEGPGSVKILPVPSGVQEFARLSLGQKIQILNILDSLTGLIDILLIDTASGISSDVMYFNASAEEIIVVVSPEPTSIADAYALMKILSVKYSRKQFKLMANMVTDIQDAREVFRRIDLVTRRFLNISIEYLGYVLADENVAKCAKMQRVVSELFPDSDASICFNALAKRICGSPSASFRNRNISLFGKYLT